MIAKEVKITNANGETISFGRHFYLLEGLNLSLLTATVSYAQTTKDGSNYQRTLLDNREFDIEFYIDRNFRDDWWIEGKRQEAFRVFNPKHNPLRIDFTTNGGKEFYLTAELVAIPQFIDDLENDNPSWLKGLLQFSASDPYIYSAHSTVADLAAWVSGFEFPLEITEEGIEMGQRSQSLIANVHNDGDSDTGMIIRFRAVSSVVNPALVNVNTYEVFKLNFELNGGDLVEVSTYKGRKTATLIRNNVRTNIFNAVALESVFLQLTPGDNLFRYDADSGLDNLEVSMDFRPVRAGV